jgi:hypothetical protein
MLLRCSCENINTALQYQLSTIKKWRENVRDVPSCVGKDAPTAAALKTNMVLAKMTISYVKSSIEEIGYKQA